MAAAGAELCLAVRYSDRPPPLQARIAGLSATLLVCLLLVGASVARWTGTAPPRVKTTALTLVEIAPPRAPPAPPSEKPPGPERVADEVPKAPSQGAETHKRAPVPQAIALSRPVPATGEQPFALPSATLAMAAFARPALQTTAPESRAVPPAPTVSDARPKWEGLLLAALNRAKRYPREAARSRQEGTARIRFVVDRRGRVHGVRLVRSSGSPVLDAEAVALPPRAAPLPRPPAELASHHIELIVPIEFFVR